MARSPRIDEPGLAYHVLNRGNGRMRLFHKDDDFAAFERVLGQGLDRYPVDLLTYCLMHNPSCDRVHCAKKDVQFRELLGCSSSRNDPEDRVTMRVETEHLAAALGRRGAG